MCMIHEDVVHACYMHSKGNIVCALREVVSISGLVVEYIVAIDVTRARFPADAGFSAIVS